MELIHVDIDCIGKHLIWCFYLYALLFGRLQIEIIVQRNYTYEVNTIIVANIYRIDFIQ